MFGLFESDNSYDVNLHLLCAMIYSKTCVKRPLKNRQNQDPYDKWQVNEGRKYCRIPPREAFCNTFDLH